MAKLQIMLFEIEGNLYGLDIKYVSGIYRANNYVITPLPNTSDIVKGITNIRGKAYPIINMRKKLGFNDIPLDSETKFIIVKIDNTDIGFIVDDVTDILKPDEKDIIDASNLIITNSDYISHVIETEERFVIVLQMKKSFLNSEILKINAGEML